MMGLLHRLKTFYLENQSPSVRVQDCGHLPPVRRFYCFSGNVQGVGFRYQAYLLASQLNLVGWVRNEPNGSVTMEIEGGEANLAEFLRAMRSVRRFHITDIQSKELEASGTEKSFEILY